MFSMTVAQGCAGLRLQMTSPKTLKPKPKHNTLKVAAVLPATTGRQISGSAKQACLSVWCRPWQHARLGLRHCCMHRWGGVGCCEPGGVRRGG